jgi:hypothetical protein
MQMRALGSITIKSVECLISRTPLQGEGAAGVVSNRDRVGGSADGLLGIVLDDEGVGPPTARVPEQHRHARRATRRALAAAVAPPSMRVALRLNEAELRIYEARRPRLSSASRYRGASCNWKTKLASSNQDIF